jgi:hypothetical protein
MMTREDRQEALSLAYVHAVAAMCGMTHETSSKDYGIDLTLKEIERRAGHYSETGLKLDLQLKSTTSIPESSTTISYDLTVKGYDDLRLLVPIRRILVVSVLSVDESQWVHQTPAKLELQQRVYWISLRGRPLARNRRSVRIAIPKRQRFTVAAVHEIIAIIKRGEEL